MSGANTKVFIVGDRAYGVVIVSFDPFHVIRIGRQAIENYAETFFPEIPSGYDQTFDMLARSVLTMVTDLSEEKVPDDIDGFADAYLDLFTNRGFRMSNAEFCVVGLIDPTLHDAHLDNPDEPSGGLEGRRKSHSMLHRALDILLKPSEGKPTDIKLEKDKEMRHVGDGDDHGHHH